MCSTGGVLGASLGVSWHRRVPVALGHPSEACIHSMIGSLLGKAGGYNNQRERVRRPQEGSVPEMRFVAVGFRFVIVSASVHARVCVCGAYRYAYLSYINSHVVLSGLAGAPRPTASRSDGSPPVPYAF